MKRKLIAIMFAVNIFIGLLPPMHAEAASIKYIERFEDQSQVEKDVPSEARIYNGQNSLSSGWYVVDKDVMLEDRLEIDGDVKLVIVDNVTLNIIKGIRVAAGNTLTVYGQKNDSGKIIAHGNSYNAGIGSNDEDDGDETAAGTVIIHGGTITARGGTDAAGIGGGNESDGGTLIIFGGNIEAKGGRYAAGIGGGDEGNSGTITIHGGTIKATAGEEAAGIGGGSTGNANRITINNGNIEAYGERQGAGIGGGYKGDCGTITINNGVVKAKCNGSPYRGAGIGSGGDCDQRGVITINNGIVQAYSNKGAGIGGGFEGNGGTINITNGLVNATSADGAGIGGGGSFGLTGGGDGGTINISGGVIIAASTKKGAGIGGGNDGDGGIINISGGHVTASGGYFDYDFWQKEMEPNYLVILKSFSAGDPKQAAWAFIMDLIFSGEYGGAGIGGGDDGIGGTVNIIGGTVVATAGLNSAKAIGHGNDESESGSLSIYDDAYVICGSLSDGTVVTDEHPVPADQREAKAQDRPFAMIALCDHPNAKYHNIGNEGHWFECDYCKRLDVLEKHAILLGGDTCYKCGYQRVLVSFEAGDGGSGVMKPVYTEKGVAYALPDNGFTAPAGKTFVGWYGTIKTPSGNKTGVFPPGSRHVLSDNLTLTARWADPYNVWVNDIQVTSANQNDILGDGKISYDPETSTLNLNNVTQLDGYKIHPPIYAKGLDLKLTGSATLTRKNGDWVHVDSGSLIIDGDFAFIGTNMPSNGIYAGNDIILAGGNIKTQGANYGIRAGRDIYIADTIKRVEADGGYKALSAVSGQIVTGPSIAVDEYRDKSGSETAPAIDRAVKEAVHIVLKPEIKPVREIEITVTGNTNTLVYNGQKQYVRRYELHCDDPAFDKNKVVFDGEAETAGIDVGTYPMNLSSSQFMYVDQNVNASFVIEDGWLKIDPADMTIEVNGNSDTEVYDGNSQSFTGTFTASGSSELFDESKFSYSGSCAVSGTDVREYKEYPAEEYCSYSDNNFNVTWNMEDPIVLNIIPAEISIDITGHKGAVTYNSSEQRIEGYDQSCSSDLYDENKVSFTGKAEAKGTQVGFYPMELDEKQFSYNDANINAKFDITDGYLIINPIPDPDKIIISVLGSKETKVYNGEEQSVTDFELHCGSEGFDPKKVVFSGTAVAKGKNAGTYPMSLSADDFSYKDESVDASFVISDGELVIEAASINIVVKGEMKEFPYDGAEHSVEGYTVSSESSLFSKEKIVFSGQAKVTRSEPGLYPMGLKTSQFSYSDSNINAQFNVTDGWLRINEAIPGSIVVTVVGANDSKAYNGQPQSISGYELHCDNEGFDPGKVTFTGTAQAQGTDVGTYQMSLDPSMFSYEGKEHATFLVTDGKLNIVPANMMIEVNGNSDTKIYNGTSQSFTGTFTASGNSPLFDASKFRYQGNCTVSGSNAGEYKEYPAKEYCSYDDKNFKVIWNMGDPIELNIDPAPVEIIIKGHTDIKNYNGEEQSVTGYDVNCDSELFDPKSVSYKAEAEVKGTEAGFYPMNLNPDLFTYFDYNLAVTFLVTDGWLRINEVIPDSIVITVIGTNDSKVYNSQRQSISGYELHCDDKNFDPLKVKYSGTAAAQGVGVGIYPMNLSADKFSYDAEGVVANFVINDGKLNIVPANMMIEVNGNSDTKIYNGTSQSFTGAFTASGSSELFDASKFRYQGNCTVSGTNSGEYKEYPAKEYCSYDDSNIKVKWEMKNPIKLNINPAAAEIIIKGHAAIKNYSGEEHIVTGYDVSCDSKLFDPDSVSYKAEAEVKGTEAGFYPMNLNPDLFAYFDYNLAVTFLVTDGWLQIKPVSVVSGHKTWVDDDNAYNKRPECIIIRLLANGEEIAQKPVSQKEDWSWRFENLPKYSGEKEIVYTIEEDALEFYKTEIDGYDVTNTYVPPQHSITYDLNGGTYEGQTGKIVESYAEGEEIFVHAAPTREGYAFVFWEGSVYYPGDVYNVTEDHTFTAVWKKEKPEPAPAPSPAPSPTPDPSPEPRYIPPRTGRD